MPPNPFLNITKDATVPGGTADAADELISYTITVENTGNQTLTGVTVTDPYADAGRSCAASDVASATTTPTSRSARPGRTRRCIR